MKMTQQLTKEEIVSRLREAFKARPRPKPPQTAAKRAEERLATAKKPTVALAQDVSLSSDALAQRLHEERGVEFTDQEIAHRQYALDCAIEATKGLREEIVRLPYHRRSTSVGPRDSDARLHVSPEDQLWGKV
jgi:hypothetical protein